MVQLADNEEVLRNEILEVWQKTSKSEGKEKPLRLAFIQYMENMSISRDRLYKHMRSKCSGLSGAKLIGFHKCAMDFKNMNILQKD